MAYPMDLLAIQDYLDQENHQDQQTQQIQAPLPLNLVPAQSGPDADADEQSEEDASNGTNKTAAEIGHIEDPESEEEEQKEQKVEYDNSDEEKKEIESDNEDFVMEYEKRPGEDGSLLRLFKSQYFTCHMLIEYLCRKGEQGVIDYLVNSMYKLDPRKIDFYLPQLCHLALNKPAAVSLKRFLLEHSVRSADSALRILYHSLTYMKGKHSVVKEEADKFSIDVEMAIVNKNPFFRGGGMKQFEGMSEQAILELFQMKQYREEYLTLQQSFIEALICYSCELKAVEPQHRIPSLKASIKQLNQFVETDVRGKLTQMEGRHLQCYKGIQFPFGIGEEPRLILNIMPDQLACFNTKKRCPIKVVFETILLSEAERWNEVMSSVPTSQEEEEYEPEYPVHGLPTMRKASVVEEHEDLDNSPTLKDEEREKDFEKLRNFAKSIEKTELRFSQAGMIQDDDIFRENPFSDPEPSTNVDSISQKQIEEIIAPPIDYQSGCTQFELVDQEEIKQVKREFLPFDDPFKTRWDQLGSDTKSHSKFGRFDSYKLMGVIVKGNDDLRQQQLAIQLISRVKGLFDEAKTSIYLRPYDIFVTGHNSGIIEYLPETISIDALKHLFPINDSLKWNLNTFYREYFFENFEEAQKNFAESLAGYSLVCYVFNIKDRHNGNIMIDSEGHIIHIDFGFMLSNSPGGINFESAHFKFTQEYLQILDGPDSWVFKYFKQLLYKGLLVIRKHIDSILTILEGVAGNSKLPCFQRSPDLIFLEIRERLKIRNERDHLSLVDRIVEESRSSWRTTQYDYFQKLTNNILY